MIGAEVSTHPAFVQRGCTWALRNVPIGQESRGVGGSWAAEGGPRKGQWMQQALSAHPQLCSLSPSSPTAWTLPPPSTMFASLGTFQASPVPVNYLHQANLVPSLLVISYSE